MDNKISSRVVTTVNYTCELHSTTGNDHSGAHSTAEKSAILLGDGSGLSPQIDISCPIVKSCGRRCKSCICCFSCKI